MENRQILAGRRSNRRTTFFRNYFTFPMCLLEKLKSGIVLSTVTFLSVSLNRFQMRELNPFESTHRSDLNNSSDVHFSLTCIIFQKLTSHWIPSNKKINCITLAECQFSKHWSTPNSMSNVRIKIFCFFNYPQSYLNMKYPKKTEAI